jgi:hypothetical protein
MKVLLELNVIERDIGGTDGAYRGPVLRGGDLLSALGQGKRQSRSASPRNPPSVSRCGSRVKRS